MITESIIFCFFDSVINCALSFYLLFHRNVYLQERNIHGKIFGGYLMKEAFELAWISAVRVEKRTGENRRGGKRRENIIELIRIQDARWKEARWSFNFNRISFYDSSEGLNFKHFRHYSSWSDKMQYWWINKVSGLELS